tara:strand:+ start:2225 stop:2962 length:738 start_codon:yes stop_codon:yes gene_type:complete
MKYILGISLTFEHFKGETKIKIFCDNTLIDDIILDKTIKTEPAFSYYPDINQTSEFVSIQSKMPVDLPEKIFLYEIDDAILGDKLSFEIEDENSNYTNGFMTRSNLLMFHQVFIMPKILLEKNNFNKLGKLFRNRFKKYDAIADAMDAKGIVGENAELNATAIDWPFYNKFYKTDSQDLHINTWFGGTTEIYMKIRKKFGIKHLWPGRAHSNNAVVMGLPVWFATYCHKYGLINKINEDQRSNNT